MPMKTNITAKVYIIIMIFICFDLYIEDVDNEPFMVTPSVFGLYRYFIPGEPALLRGSVVFLDKPPKLFLLIFPSVCLSICLSVQEFILRFLKLVINIK